MGRCPVSSGCASPVISEPSFGFTIKYARETELLPVTGRSCRPAYLMAAHAGPDYCQFPLLEANWYLVSSA